MDRSVGGEEVFPFEALPTNLASDILRQCSHIVDRIMMSQSSPEARKLVLGKGQNGDGERGILGTLRLLFHLSPFHEEPGVLLVSPPPYSADNSFKFMNWFRALLPFLNRYLRAFESVELSQVHTATFPILSIFLRLLHDSEFQGRVSIDFCRIESNLLVAYCSEFVDTLKVLAETGRVSFSLELANFSCPNFWMRFNQALLPSLAPKIHGFAATVYPKNGFQWENLEKLTSLESLSTAVTREFDQHSVISAALPQLTRLTNLEFEDVPLNVLSSLTNLRKMTFSTERNTGDAEQFLNELVKLPKLTKLDFEFRSDVDGRVLVPLFSGGTFQELQRIEVHTEFASRMGRFFQSFPDAPRLTNLSLFINEWSEDGNFDTASVGEDLIVMELDLTQMAYLKTLRTLHITTGKYVKAARRAHTIKLSGDLSGMDRLRRLIVDCSTEGDPEARARAGAGEESDDEEDDYLKEVVLTEGLNMPARARVVCGKGKLVDARGGGGSGPAAAEPAGPSAPSRPYM